MKLFPSHLQFTIKNEIKIYSVCLMDCSDGPFFSIPISEDHENGYS